MQKNMIRKIAPVVVAFAIGVGATKLVDRLSKPTDLSDLRAVIVGPNQDDAHIVFSRGGNKVYRVKLEPSVTDSCIQEARDKAGIRVYEVPQIAGERRYTEIK